jgi:hypothetical protein
VRSAIRELWRKLIRRPAAAAPVPPADSRPISLEEVLVERFAAHFPGAMVTGPTVAMPFAGLSVRCELGEAQMFGGKHTVACYFWLSGGPFDNGPVFASVSGYGANPMEAVVMGCCNWACAFGPVLRAGLGGELPPDVDSFDALVDGQPVRVHLQHLDRTVTSDDADGSPEDKIRQARERLGPNGWLLRRVVESGTLPVLRSDRPVLLSAFVMDKPDALVEVKVNGGDWPLAHAALADLGPVPAGAIPMMRELGVMIPLSPPPPLSRGALARTLRALAPDEGRSPRSSTTWRGFRSYPAQIDALPSATGLDLPDDYAAFLRDAALAGAGPGYGLLSPSHPAQGALLERQEPPGPSVALAHAGCGVMWLLALEGKTRGEVWVDAGGSDGSVKRVDASFSAWYRRWMDSVVRDSFPWIDWDSGACATASIFVQLHERLRNEGVSASDEGARMRTLLKVGSIRLRAGGSDFFDAGDAIDPCAGCVALAARLGVSEDVFAIGIPPHQGR